MFNRDYNINTDLDELYSELRVVQGLAGSPMGERLQKMTADWVDTYSTDLAVLAVEQAKASWWKRLTGGRELIYKQALCEVAKRLCDALAVTAAQEGRIKSDIAKRETVRNKIL
ncbi:MAG: hypothetical protein U9N61_08075 [Euryarchaeota archaeon]|nr:hypothetical protein [Euryarchaeota archaeon]